MSNKFLGSGIPFYYGTTHQIIVAFAKLFSDIKIETEGTIITVPIVYSAREKFISKLYERPDNKTLTVDTVLPRMGFDDVSLSFSPERSLNKMQEIKSKNVKTQNTHMFNRIPYDMNFELVIATKNKEDDIRIAEQIYPSFNPAINVTINDVKDFDIETDILIKMDSVSVTTDYEGSYKSKRTIIRKFSFTVEMYFYCPYSQSQRIKHVDIKIGDDERQRILSQIKFDVDPETAERDDPHDVIVTVIEG